MSRLVTAIALVVIALALAAGSAPRAQAQQAVNPIHPTFVPLDAEGNPLTRAEDLSADTTCGACHDHRYIDAHSEHTSANAKASCPQCHVDGGKLDLGPGMLDEGGRLRREALRIGAPRAENCARCHGLITGSDDPVVLPADFEVPATTTGRTWSLTQGEGAILSPQRMADSFLNLEGKANLRSPWDVHAAKLIDCVACHYAGNNPARTDGKHAALKYVTADPRRQSTAEFLVRPDHRLAKQACRGCHEPREAHEFLPYRARHMAVLSCQTCHLAAPMGPLVEMIDATVVTLGGSPAVRYRNVARHAGEALNTATVRPVRPLLVERVESDGIRRLAPVNLVSRFRWVSGADRTEVPFALVAQAFLEDGGYAAVVLERFDRDHDGEVDVDELRLDGKPQTDLVARRLEALGVAQPSIEGTVQPYPLAHGVPSRERALRDCTACHASDSWLAATYPIAGYLPGGSPPRPTEQTSIDLSGVLSPTPQGGLTLERGSSTPASLHVLGHSRDTLSNSLGFSLFMIVFVGVLVHAVMRLVLHTRRSLHAPLAPAAKAYVFSLYERFWHWTMAISGVVLIVTGLAIHGAGSRWAIGIATAVSLHNAFAVVLMLNAFLSLFYHLTTRAILNFIPEPRGLLARMTAHMAYQSRGIFRGRPHPSNAPGQKLNPLQQITYLALLNVLFPLQIGTGLLIWAVGHSPDVATAMGGLYYLAPLHNLGSWLFLSFFVLHVYLVTTGRTPTEHLTSMITGFQAVEAKEPPEERS